MVGSDIWIRHSAKRTGREARLRQTRSSQHDAMSFQPAREVVVLWASQTGNAEDFATGALATALSGAGHTHRVLGMDETAADALPPSKNTSTVGIRCYRPVRVGRPPRGRRSCCGGSRRRDYRTGHRRVRHPSWLDTGAHFYICGDANRMAKDVDRALREIVAHHGNLDTDDADAYVKKLSTDKRYVRDVY